jgi:hypothetical protein
MDWAGELLRDIAAIAFAVVVALTVIVTIIERRFGWKSGGKWIERLKWAHDKLSTFALGNQRKLDQPRLPSRMAEGTLPPNPPPHHSTLSLDEVNPYLTGDTPPEER